MPRSFDFIHILRIITYTNFIFHFLIFFLKISAFADSADEYINIIQNFFRDAFDN